MISDKLEILGYSRIYHLARIHFPAGGRGGGRGTHPGFGYNGNRFVPNYQMYSLSDVLEVLNDD